MLALTEGQYSQLCCREQIVYITIDQIHQLKKIINLLENQTLIVRINYVPHRSGFVGTHYLAFTQGRMFNCDHDYLVSYAKEWTRQQIEVSELGYQTYWEVMSETDDQDYLENLGSSELWALYFLWAIKKENNPHRLLNELLKLDEVSRLIKLTNAIIELKSSLN